MSSHPKIINYRLPGPSGEGKPSFYHPNDIVTIYGSTSGLVKVEITARVILVIAIQGEEQLNLSAPHIFVRNGLARVTCNGVDGKMPERHTYLDAMGPALRQLGFRLDFRRSYPPLVVPISEERKNDEG